MNHVLFFGGIFILAALLAALEVQIEGHHGWAANLPTWRVDNALTRKLLSGRPLTGYHVFLFTFVFVALHVPFINGLTDWTLAREMRVLAFNFLFWVLEDFLWFIFNPAYGWKKFSHREIWWHAPTWWWIAPRDYWVYTALGLALYALSNHTA